MLLKLQPDLYHPMQSLYNEQGPKFEGKAPLQELMMEPWQCSNNQLTDGAPGNFLMVRIIPLGQGDLRIYYFLTSKYGELLDAVLGSPSTNPEDRYHSLKLSDPDVKQRFEEEKAFWMENAGLLKAGAH